MTTKKNTNKTTKPQAITDKKAKTPKIKSVTLHMHANGAAFSDARPGCLAVLVARCIATTKDKPITKKELLAYMCEKFEDRDPVKMKSTVTGQLPSQLKGEKGIIMRQIFDETSTPPTPTGKYYFDTEATDIERGEGSKWAGVPLAQSKQFAGPAEKKKA